MLLDPSHVSWEGYWKSPPSSGFHPSNQPNHKQTQFLCTPNRLFQKLISGEISSSERTPGVFTNAQPTSSVIFFLAPVPTGLRRVTGIENCRLPLVTRFWTYPIDYKVHGFEPYKCAGIWKISSSKTRAVKIWRVDSSLYVQGDIITDH